MVQATSESTDSVDCLLGRVADEILQRMAAGERPDAEEYARRHPEIADLIRDVFPALDLVSEKFSHDSIPELLGGGARLAENRQLGDFRILREIGRGGMGVVYEAEQLSMGRRVAVKVLPFAALIEPKALKRFENEVRAAATLDHAHITAVHAVGEDGGLHYFAMQLVRGPSLATVLQELIRGDRQSSLSGSTLTDVVSSIAAPTSTTGAEDDASDSNGDQPAAADGPTRAPAVADRDYFRSVALLGVSAAEALQHAHAHGVVHRDIKPGNLLLDISGKLWVTDFGLARLDSAVSVTTTGGIVGTLRYMSPEQAMAGQVVIDHRTDIYSLGATLYELLTRRPLFTSENRADLLRQIAFQEPLPPRKMDPRIPRELQTIVLCALSKSAGERYASAQALADDLRAFLECRPIQARPITPLQRVTKWSQRHMLVVTIAVLALLASTIGLSVSTYLISEQRNETKQALALMREERDEAARQRADARRNFQRARAAVDHLFTEVSEKELVGVPSLQPLRKDLLERALKYYQEFITERGDDIDLQAELAAAYFRVGNITWKIESAESALAPHREALAIREKLVEAHPANLDYQNDLALSQGWMGFLLIRTGETDEGLSLYEEAIELQEHLLEVAPDVLAFQSELADSYFYLAVLRGELLQTAEAMQLYEQAARLQEELVQQDPEDFRYQARLAACYCGLAGHHANLQQTDAAVRLYESAIAIRSQLIELHPGVPGFQAPLAELYFDFAELKRDLGRKEQAAQLYGKAIELAETLVVQNPDVPLYQEKLDEMRRSAGLAPSE